MEVFRKKLNQTWKATSSNRLNLLLWRVMSRKLPTRETTNKWGRGSPMCPRCHAKVESVRHALWDCLAVQPWWRSCSTLLEACGVTERIGWKQVLLGIKGRMNPEFHKLWQFIRATLISNIWYDRNQIAHQKAGLNIDSSKVKGWVKEACNLAREKKTLRIQADILLKRISKV